MGNRFVVVGGGSTQSPGILEVLRKRAAGLNSNDLVLYNIDEERVSLLEQYTEMYYEELGFKVNVTYTTNIDGALKGADFLFMQIRPGLDKQRTIDEKICLNNGVVGQETCGLGGSSFAMRVIPAILETAKKTKRICPRVWILDYTDPEAILLKAIYHEFPDANVLYTCDMPISIEGAIAEYFNKRYYDLTLKYSGLNHFGWWSNVYDENGFDLLPQLREDVLSGKTDMLLMSNDEAAGDKYWVDAYKQMISLFKCFPEYFPNCYLQYYLTPDEVVAYDDVSFIRGGYAMQGREKRIYDECRRVTAAGSAKDSLLHTGVYGNYIVDTVHAITHDTRERLMVDKKNHGAISDSDPEAVVETLIYAGSMGAETISTDEIPTFQRGLMEVQKAYEKMIVDVALSGSCQVVSETVIFNKTIPNYTVSKKVLDESYAVNRGLRPELK